MKTGKDHMIRVDGQHLLESLCKDHEISYLCRGGGDFLPVNQSQMVEPSRMHFAGQGLRPKPTGVVHV